MSMPTATFATQRTLIASRFVSWLELTKPKIASLVLATVAVAAFIGSWAAPDPWILLHTLLGTALVAASASALNQWLERKTDARMPRTADRPLPAGRLGSTEVVLFGLVTFVVGAVWLYFAVNATTAALGVATWVIYVVLYTPLKSRTTLNTVVGAVAGADTVHARRALAAFLGLAGGEVHQLQRAHSALAPGVGEAGGHRRAAGVGAL